MSSLNPVADDEQPFEFPIRLGGRNEPIQLHSGAVTFRQRDVTFTADCTIVLDWLPTPRICFYDTIVPDSIHLDGATVELTLPSGVVLPDCFINFTSASDQDGYRQTISGVFNQEVQIGNRDQLSCAFFALPNFPNILGRNLKISTDSSVAGRFVFQDSNWKITLIVVEDARNLVSDLERNSGYAITHIGRLQRSDEQPFSTNDARLMLIAFAYYLSFAAARWTTPCLAFGLSHDLGVVWQRWDAGRIAPFLYRTSWIPRYNSLGLELPFAGFLNRWVDSDWEEPIRLAIHWYIEASAMAGSIEGSITLSQMGIEVLSTVLEDRDNTYTFRSKKSGNAHESIRSVFTWLHLPTGPITSLVVLLDDMKFEFAKTGNKEIADLPRLMAYVRNKISHPTNFNRSILKNITVSNRFDVWKVSLWVLELCLLRIYKYKGSYFNRVDLMDQMVPWANQAASQVGD